MAKGSGPVSESTYFILAALLDGPLHGHGIIKHVLGLSEGRVKLPVGTLYGALDRLAGGGLIAVEREEVVDGRPRRYFRLTDDGTRLVLTEAERMRQAASVVTGRALPGSAFVPLTSRAAVGLALGRRAAWWPAPT
ncbi:PadR family transcriptional regulator [Spongiactinospora sp. 9N601]|uniref:PadR family transcriptional regulator n=1 Tax=Spongiactinospora sp. 9N601 TaxID=3375149 RepID=UPI00379D896F